MRTRSRQAAALLAIALASVLAASCSGPQSRADRSGSPSPSHTASRSMSSSTAPVSTAPVSSSQSAITVVAPPDSSSTPDSGSSTPSPSTARSSRGVTAGSTRGPVVTTTVTVTPTTQSTTKPAPPTTTSARTRSVKSTTARATTARSSTTQSSTRSNGIVAGLVVVIDPGHNGANAAHPEIITQQVPAGFGQHKNCNTTGTETNAGYPEYKFNWKVALSLRDALKAKGITVVMTRDSDDGVGPCVNKRAAIGNDAHADAVISIHGDGESAGIKGFYVMTAARAPAGTSMATQSTSLAVAVRDGLAGAGFPPSNAIGSHGLWTRSDLAGLNLSVRPTVMIECGNMRNATEAALMSSANGQQRYAAGIAVGVLAYLGG